jgi:hypothetical protein
MTAIPSLRELLEREEIETVGNAFGGSTTPTHNSYSVVAIRNLIVDLRFQDGTALGDAVRRARSLLDARLFSLVVENLVRFSFLIELTNLKVTSTKMKTRWLPATIQMSQAGSFTPVDGTFEPGSDPRASAYEECAAIFTKGCNLICDKYQSDAAVGDFLRALSQHSRVPYELPFSYKDPAATRSHTEDNVVWALTDDIQWLLNARKLLGAASGTEREALRETIKKKLEVKVFKTDRSLTGKDKTNRAKRWEVLSDDFQHATIEQCWSAERQLTQDLVGFEGFPADLQNRFVSESLVLSDQPQTRCPVTLEILSFQTLSASVLDPTHGVSDYQVGHLHPLKRGGRHEGANVRWQSADGNRIQGDLTIDETTALLDGISQRRHENV